jgi:hypothetical protein
MALDTKLIQAIRSKNYNAWAESKTPSRPGITCDTDDLLEPFTDHPEFRSITAGRWKRIVSWDLGKLHNPSAMLIIKFRELTSGWGYSRFNRFPAESYVTPIYQVIGAYESHDDYTEQVMRIQALQAQMGDDPWCIFDGSGVGVAVEESVRYMDGFERVVALQIVGGESMKTSGRFTVTGKSKLLSELEQAIKQKRVQIPDVRALDKLNRQLKGLQVEETVQGHYRTIDDKRGNDHFDQLMALAMGIAYVEYQMAMYRPFQWVC